MADNMAVVEVQRVLGIFAVARALDILVVEATGIGSDNIRLMALEILWALDGCKRAELELDEYIGLELDDLASQRSLSYIWSLCGRLKDPLGIDHHLLRLVPTVGKCCRRLLVVEC